MVTKFDRNNPEHEKWFDDVSRWNLKRDEFIRNQSIPMTDTDRVNFLLIKIEEDSLTTRAQILGLIERERMLIDVFLERWRKQLQDYRAQMQATLDSIKESIEFTPADAVPYRVADCQMLGTCTQKRWKKG